MEALENEQVAEALARVVLKQLEPVLHERHSTIVSELVAIRKREQQTDATSNHLFKKLADLERKLDTEIEVRKTLRSLEQDTLTKLNKYLDSWVY